MANIAHKPWKFLISCLLPLVELRIFSCQNFQGVANRNLLYLCNRRSFWLKFVSVFWVNLSMPGRCFSGLTIWLQSLIIILSDSITSSLFSILFRWFNGEISGISGPRPPSLRFGAPVRGVKNTEGWPRRGLAKSGRRRVSRKGASFLGVGRR
jgi:hypothetical protein